MTTSRQSTWTTTEPQTVTFVELFFDLVFVYAVTQITSLLAHDLSWKGLIHALLVLWLVWWAWTQFTWTLNPADTEHSAVRLITLAAGGAAFFMAQAVSDAFSVAGPWFAVSYVVVRMLGLALQVESTWKTEYWVGARLFAGLSMIGLALVVIGGFVGSPLREWIWVGAIVVDLISAQKAGSRAWTIHAEHFAERHGLIIIIALGESLIAAGVAVADAPRGLTFATAAILAVVLVSAAWWIYFGTTMEMLRGVLERSTPENRGAVARDLYSLGHLPIVAGIIALAVGVEMVLAHPDEALKSGALIALIAGAALYVGGVAWARHSADQGSLVFPLVIVAAIAVAAALAGTVVGLVPLAVVAIGFIVYALTTSRMATPN